jgi:hypothetical protein
MQPNNDRTDEYIGRPGENNITTRQVTPPELGAGDSHNINAISWNQYPDFAGSRNYMVTDAEYLGGYSYQYTSNNRLEVGDYVVVSNAGEFSFSYPQPVLYADKLKFVIDNELGTGPKLTGLRARVDKVDTYNVGHTRYIDEGEKSFLWPSYGFCYNTFNSGDGKWQDMIEYLRAAGVDPESLVEATFTGGEDKYDYSGDAEYSYGVLFWDYIPADEIININWETGEVILGKDLDGYVIASENSWGQEVPVNPNSDLDISFVAFTNDPAKDTSNWWY